jgi:hypothetical protein
MSGLIGGTEWAAGMEDGARGREWSAERLGWQDSGIVSGFCKYIAKASACSQSWLRVGGIMILLLIALILLPGLIGQSGTSLMAQNQPFLEKAPPAGMFDENNELKFRENDRGTVSELFYGPGTISYVLGGKIYNTNQRPFADPNGNPRRKEWRIQRRTSSQSLVPYSKSSGFARLGAVGLGDAKLWVFQEEEKSLPSAVVLALAFSDRAVDYENTPMTPEASFTVPPRTVARLEVVFGEVQNEVTVQINEQKLTGNNGKTAFIENLKSGDEDPLTLKISALANPRGQKAGMRILNVQSRRFDENHILLVGQSGDEPAAFAAVLILRPLVREE